ncbi:MAG TPA: hypothetical protein PL003_08560 [Bacteroidales bacterium]|nr:hypothetical protein [Bacteroidales bacterium]
MRLKSEYHDNILNAMVRWTEDGSIYRGIVTDIFIRQGVKYLNVMTIFGKRRSVKMSKVKFLIFRDQ